MMIFEIDIGNKYKAVYIIFSLIQALFFSGIIFGWSSIEVLLANQGFFANSCVSQQTARNSTANHAFGNASKSHEGNSGCSTQSKQLNLVFTLCSSSQSCFLSIIGLFVDKYGPKAGQMLGCILNSAGGIGLAFVSPAFANALFPIFIFFAVGGGFIYTSLMQTARMIYADEKSFIISLISGAYDSSAIVLLLFMLANEQNISIRDSSLFFVVFGIVLSFIQIGILLPSHSFMQEQALKSELPNKRPEDDVSGTTKLGDAAYKLFPDTLRKSLTSVHYLLELAFLCIIQLRLFYFIGSINELIEVNFPNQPKEVLRYTEYFGYTQLCGILVTPIVGIILDRNSMKCNGAAKHQEDYLLPLSQEDAFIKRLQDVSLPLLITSFFGLLLSLLVLIKSSFGLLLAFVLHVVTRGFLYGCHFSFIGAAFKSQNFGTLSGFGVFAAGIFSLLGYPLYKLTRDIFGTDPFWVNVALLFLVALTVLCPVYLFYACKVAKESCHVITSVHSQQKNESTM